MTDAALIDEPAALPTQWRGVIAVEGSSTDDGRTFDPGALDWRPLPLPLMWQPANGVGHDGGVIVGNITSIARDGDLIIAEGTFDLNGEAGMEAARLVGEGFLRGVSVDVAVDDADVDIIEVDDTVELVFHAGLVMGATLLPLPAFAEAIIEPFAADDDDFEWAARIAAVRAAAVFALTDDENAFLDALAQLHADELDLIANATLTDPAVVDFAAAHAEEIAAMTDQIDALRNPPAEAVPVEPAMTAAGGPIHPPRAWFDDPALLGPTPLQVTDEGRVFGHLATFDTCHIGYGEAAGQCVNAPRSTNSYAYFLTGEVVTAEGERRPVGHLTVGGAHAPLRDSGGAALGHRPASAHYEHTGWCGADVAAGEDEWGIWVAGAARPDLDDTRLRELQAAPLSGDWRRIAGNLELVGVLAVNVPGFPVRRVEAVMAGGEPQVLLAAVRPDPSRLTSDQLDRVAERIALSVGRSRPQRAARIAERLGR